MVCSRYSLLPCTPKKIDEFIIKKKIFFYLHFYVHVKLSPLSGFSWKLSFVFKFINISWRESLGPFHKIHFSFIIFLANEKKNFFFSFMYVKFFFIYILKWKKSDWTSSSIWAHSVVAMWKSFFKTFFLILFLVIHCYVVFIMLCTCNYYLLWIIKYWTMWFRSYFINI